MKTETRPMILRYLNLGGTHHVRDIAAYMRQAFKVSAGTTRTALCLLAREGCAQRLGRGRYKIRFNSSTVESTRD